MNEFTFIGRIIKPKENQFIKKMPSGNKMMKLLIRQNETNSAYVQIASDLLYQGNIRVLLKNKGGRQLIPYEDRFDKKLLQNISPFSKVITNLSTQNGEDIEFIYKEDFINYINKHLEDYPQDTLFEIKGEYSITEYKNKFYNNFNIRSLKVVNNNTRPEFTMKLNLFYNYEGLDESDKKNKFILNAYIEQYVYNLKQTRYIPIQVEFITNRFDFKNATDVEVIKHRKANMLPPKDVGYVKAVWEAQYVRGAQLILPPLETLPKDIQFEIINAGRDIKEYMSNIVSEASEIICLTRPDNTLSKDGEVYTSLGISDNEFESKIYETDNLDIETIDKIADEDAKQNPFN